MNLDDFKLEYNEGDLLDSAKATFVYEQDDIPLVAYAVEGFANGRFLENTEMTVTYTSRDGYHRTLRIGGMPVRVWRLWLEILRMRGHAPQPQETVR